MNDMLVETKKLVPEARSIGTAVDLFNPDSGTSSALVTKSNDLDPIEDLMNKLSQARNRKEKRRLLAEYNQQQELVWGQARSIAAIQNAQEESTL
jgi:hypothetical protein